MKLAFTVECNANKFKLSFFVLYGTKFCDVVKTLSYLLVSLREPTERHEPNNKCKTVVDFDTIKLTESSLSEYIVPNKWDLLQPNAVMNLPTTSKTFHCESLIERTQILVQQSTVLLCLF